MKIPRTYVQPFAVLTVLLLVTLYAPTAVRAQGDAEGPAQGPGGPGGPEGFRPRDPLAIYREAGINSDQENQIKELAKQFEEANASRLKSVMSELQEMKELSLKPEPDEQAVIGKQEEISKLQGEMGMERIKLLLKIRHVLNAEQKKRLVELMQKNMSGQPGN